MKTGEATPKLDPEYLVVFVLECKQCIEFKLFKLLRTCQLTEVNLTWLSTALSGAKQILTSQEATTSHVYCICELL